MKSDLIQNIHCQNKLIMTHVMKRAFHILELPLLELKEFIYLEIEKNPLLEIEDFNSKKPMKANINFDIEDKISFFEYLMNQASETFDLKQDLIIAENIIGNLNENGYFNSSLVELSQKLKVSVVDIEKILHVIQTFDPIGVAAKNLQESLLIQLNNSRLLAYKIIRDHYPDLLKNNMAIIAKKLKTTPRKIQKCMEKNIRNLNFNPRSEFTSEQNYSIIPDIIIKKEDKNWVIEINEELVPLFNINSKYKNLTSKSEIKSYFLSAKFLMKGIQNRRRLLLNIAMYLVKKQRPYLLLDEELLPMTIKEVSKVLKHHISTISRAIKHKYIQTPRGLFLLKDLFSKSLKKTKSTKAEIDTLKDLIAKEDKSKPFSDQMLEKKMKEKGFSTKRRTITMYRKKLMITTSRNRKRIY